LASNDYRTVHGIVQFPPREGEANGKDVTNITVRQNGFGDQNILVSATIWPELEVTVAEGDVVTMDGKYRANKTTKDGAPVTYHNLSVTRLLNHGQSVEAKKPDVENESPVEDAGDDDIPF